MHRLKSLKGEIETLRLQNLARLLSKHDERKTGLAEKKEKMTQLLNEKRQKMINEVEDLASESVLSW